MDDCLDLECNPALLTAARAFVRSRLESWEAEEMVPDAELVASELVTNAVLHARTNVRLKVALESDTVRIDVFDGNSRLPTMVPCGLDATSGRGLALVAALATAWGIEQQGDGKSIWAEIGSRDPEHPDDCVDLSGVGTVEQALEQVERTDPQASDSHPA